MINRVNIDLCRFDLKHKSTCFNASLGKMVFSGSVPLTHAPRCFVFNKCSRLGIIYFLRK